MWLTIPRPIHSRRQRAQADLDDVTAEEQDDSRPVRWALGDVVDDRPEVAGGKNIGKAVEEGVEGTVGTGRLGEEWLLNFVGTPGDGNWS